MTTQEILRLGFSHEDIRFARRCCLRRLSRGSYLVRHVCELEKHRPLWASIEEDIHESFTEHGDMRDQIKQLNAAVMARCGVRSQTRAKQAGRSQGSEATGTFGAIEVLDRPATVRRSSSPTEQSPDGRAPSPAAAQTTPPTEVFSHISAALIHGLPVAYPVTHQVEVMRPGVNRRHKSLHVRGGSIPKHHREAIRGTEVTTLERTLIDVARSYNPDISVAMLDSALHRELTTREKILKTLAQCLETRNTKKVHRALDLADGRRESPAESIAAVRFFQHGIDGFVPQTEFDAKSLQSKIRVDFCHRTARLIVEVDGIGKLYLGSGVPRQELEKERQREQWLRDRNWRIVRISWKELFKEAKFDEISRILVSYAH